MNYICSKNNPAEDGTRYNIYTDGLKIYTTINADLQKYAEQAVKARMAYLQELFDRQWNNRDPLGKRNAYILDQLGNTKRYKSLKKKGLSGDEILDALNVPEKMEIFTWQGMKEVEMSPYDSVAHYAKFLQAGLLSVEAKTGYVRAWVGGINSRYFKYDHVTSRRQAGSTFKPIVYSAALRKGLDPCTFIPNDSVAYREYNHWTLRNSNGEYGGYGQSAYAALPIWARYMQKIYRDPLYRYSRQLSFEIPDRVLEDLDCEDYRESIKPRSRR